MAARWMLIIHTHTFRRICFHLDVHVSKQLSRTLAIFFTFKTALFYMQCYSGLGNRMFIDQLLLGNRMFIDQLLHKPQKLLFLGPPCSTDAPTVAEVAHYWNLITVNKNKYKNKQKQTHTHTHPHTPPHTQME